MNAAPWRDAPNPLYTASMLPSQPAPGPAPGTAGGDLDPRRKRALFRAWHRGTREMDIIMGRFAEREMRGLSDEELVLFEHLLELPEPDLFGWLMGQAAPPPDIDETFLQRLRAYGSRG